MKHFKILLATMLAAVIVVGSFAFTSKDYHPGLATLCFEYTGADNPDADEATASSSYDEGINPLTECGEERITLCAICFDDTMFPLVGGQPDFAGQPVLDQLVRNNRNNTGSHGIQIFAPFPHQDKWVTLYFRPENAK